MHTVGQLLKEERVKKGFSLDQVEKATKIRRKFLEAIEKDEYRDIPASPYVQGFIKNYSDFLGLRSHTLLALLRRQLQEKKGMQARIEEPLTPSSWRLTPNKAILALVILLVGALFSYFYWQYQLLHAPPPLVVENPKDELVTKDLEVAVYGKTDPDVSLTINHEPVVVKKDGKFYKNIELTEGSNTISVEATTRVGEKSTVVRRVTKLPSQDMDAP